MNNFFITGISGRKKTKLKKAEILFAEMEIDGVNGLVFDQERIVDALNILASDVSAQAPTSIPGLVKLEIVASFTVNFNPETMELSEPAKTGVIISAPEGYRCDNWKWLLEKVEIWAKSNLSHIKTVFIHEGCINTPRFEVKADELHLVLGEHLNLPGAKILAHNNMVEYYPAGRLICLRYIHNRPGVEDFDFIVRNINDFLPAVLASTIEEADTLVPYQVSFLNWDGDMNRGQVEEIVRKTLPRTLCPGVVIRVPHGKIASPVADDKLLQIFIWSASSGSRNRKTPATMWGQEVSCRDDSFSPTETGLNIYESNGRPVAEVIGNNLYIFHDACHYSYPADYKILEKILEEASKIFAMPETERLAIINAPKVILSDPTGSGLDNFNEFKQITEEIILPVLNRKIIFHHSQGMVNAPLNDGFFHIWLYSASGGNSISKKLPAKIFGFNTNNDNGWNYFMPTEVGVEIIDDDSLFCPAELLDNNLYIHMPLSHHRMSGGLNIYGRILELTVAELKRTPAEKAERDQVLKARRFERNIKSYVQICHTRQNLAIDRVVAEIKSINTSIAEYQKAVIEKIRKEAELNHNLASLKYQQISSDAELEAEFHRLFKIEGVENVKVEDGKLIIHTYNIYITAKNPSSGKDMTFDIGKFRIEVYFNGDHGGILFFNITRKGNGGWRDYNVHHPHVNSQGLPCLGNIKETIGQLIAEYQFSAIIVLAIQYLESVNINDQAGADIFKCWPVVE